MRLQKKKKKSKKVGMGPAIVPCSVLVPSCFLEDYVDDVGVQYRTAMRVDKETSSRE